MTTTDEENYLRSSLLLLKGGIFITRKVVTREEQKENKNSGRNLDDLLIEKKGKLEREFRNHKHRENLFPANRKTEVEKWDISLLTGVLQIVFRTSITENERKAVRSIKHQRNDVYAHSATAELSCDEYSDMCAELKEALRNLAAEFPQEVKTECEDIINSCLNGPIDIKSHIEHLKRVSDTDNMCRAILEKIDANGKQSMENIKTVVKQEHVCLKKDIAEDISNSQEAICKTFRDVQLTKADFTSLVIDAVQQALQEQRSTRKVKVVDSELEVSGKDVDKHNIELAEQMIKTVTNEAIRRTQTSEEHQDIREAIQEILDEIASRTGVKALKADIACVVIKFSCETYEQLLQLLVYLDSDDIKHRLTKLAALLSHRLETKEQLHLSISLSVKCLQDILKELETDSQSEYKRSIHIPIQFDSVEGMAHIWNYFENGGATNSLNKLSEALSAKLGTTIKLTSSLNVEGFKSALDEFGSENTSTRLTDQSRVDSDITLVHHQGNQVLSPESAFVSTECEDLNDIAAASISKMKEDLSGANIVEDTFDLEGNNESGSSPESPLELHEGVDLSNIPTTSMLTEIDKDLPGDKVFGETSTLEVNNKSLNECECNSKQLDCEDSKEPLDSKINKELLYFHRSKGSLDMEKIMGSFVRESEEPVLNPESSFMSPECEDLIGIAAASIPKKEDKDLSGPKIVAETFDLMGNNKTELHKGEDLSISNIATTSILKEIDNNLLSDKTVEETSELEGNNEPLTDSECSRKPLDCEGSKETLYSKSNVELLYLESSKEPLGLKNLMLPFVRENKKLESSPESPSELHEGVDLGDVTLQGNVQKDNLQNYFDVICSEKLTDKHFPVNLLDLYRRDPSGNRAIVIQYFPAEWHETDVQNYLEIITRVDIKTVCIPAAKCDVAIAIFGDLVYDTKIKKWQEKAFGKPAGEFYPTLELLEQPWGIFVSDVPAGVTDEFLQLYFESGKSGGIEGTVVEPVEHARIEDKNYAVITIDNAEALKSILSKQNHRLKEMDIELEPFYPSVHWYILETLKRRENQYESSPESPSELHEGVDLGDVTLQGNVQKDDLQNYFDVICSEKLTDKHFPVNLLDLYRRDPSGNRAIVIQHFPAEWHETNVQNYLEVITRVDIKTVCIPAAKCDVAIAIFGDLVYDTRIQKWQEEKAFGKPAGVFYPTLELLGQPSGIFVSDVPAGVTDEFLQLYFESGKSGGIEGTVVEPVEHATIEDKNYAVITIDNAEALKSILSKQNHRLKEMDIELEPFYPSVHWYILETLKRRENQYESSPESPSELHEGVDLGDVTLQGNVQKDNLQNYFDVICSEKLTDKHFPVNLLDLYRRDPSGNRAIVIQHFPAEWHETNVQNYLEVITRVDIKTVCIPAAKCDVAIAIFGDLVYDTRIQKWQEEKAFGKPAGVFYPTLELLGQPSGIFVSDVPAGVTDEFLQLYFESGKSGGIEGTVVEPVEHATIEDKNYAVITIDNAEALKSILSKQNHRLKEMDIELEPFYPSVHRYILETLKRRENQYESSPESPSELHEGVDLGDVTLQGNVQKDNLQNYFDVICSEKLTDKHFPVNLLDLYRRDPSGNRAIVIQHFPAEWHETNVQNYLEIITRVDIKTVCIPAAKCDVAIAIFGDLVYDTRIQKRQQKAFDKPAGQFYPTLELLGQPSGIFVSDVPAGVTDEFLQLYFESGKSGGIEGTVVEPVEHATIEDKNYAVITIDNAEALKSILSKQNHRLKAMDIELEPFYPSVHRYILETLKRRENQYEKDRYKLKGLKASVSKAHADILKVLLEEKNSTDQTRKRKAKPKRETREFVERMVYEEPEAPSYWKNYKEGETLFQSDKRFFMGNKFENVELSKDSREFKSIVNMVNATFDARLVGEGKDAIGLDALGYTKLFVLKIERIENFSLYEPFARKRQTLFRQLHNSREVRFPKIEELQKCTGAIATSGYVHPHLNQDIYAEINEYLLFHSTKKKRVSAICNDGFDLRVGSGTAMFGAGIYGAEKAMKADQYADETDKRSAGQGNPKKMFLIRMVLGNGYLCSEPNPHKYRKPPCTRCYRDDCTNHSHVKGKFGHFFDSVVGDNSKLFREFVVYENSLCYPEYLITYERR